MALCNCRVESCMGCIPLQRGAIIIGFLNLFSSMLKTFKYIRILIEFELKVKECEEARPMRSPAFTIHNESKYDYYETARDELRACPKGRVLALARMYIVIPIFIMFIYFILTALMIHGTRQERPKLIAPWLWWQLFLLVVSLLSIIGLQSHEDFFLNITLLLVNMYLFMVVNSFYLKLLQQERNPSRVTVIAMARRRSDMTVSFPSPLKDDPPPPYHSCYVPVEAVYPPPYDTSGTTTHGGSMPPPYQSMDPLASSSSAGPQEEPHSNPTLHVPSPANPSSGTSSPTTPEAAIPEAATPEAATPEAATSNTDTATRDTQEQETRSEGSCSPPEAVGERVPLVVKLPTSQNN
ncbi:uncharacterized protein LOC123507153 [Portunus trituberculatus]|uniref:uncharacterized protein LOC123507153 n=1 Tax=Portunus trituberculatus TaxID=210409 RepID=UPI001E1CD2BD|nr:uncharacterized protein LOC123507153 [Portunus trituberculatus]XP_045115734.1 uncharacterized protein LOC123507153 [Portunus trituberculatus]